MECGESLQAASRSDKRADSQDVGLSSDSPPPPLPSPDAIAESRREEKAKRTKVHKREKELFGFVTPIFLPLLDASDASREKEKEKRPQKKADTNDGSPSDSDHDPSSRDAEQGKERQPALSKDREGMEESHLGSTPFREDQEADAANKSKRSAIKKSSLRHSGEKRRRKRVSLVIDDQIVLPAEDITEPPLMSPSETTASSASNSTASLDDAIDPRLIGQQDTPIYKHDEPMHHSLQLPSPLPSTSPTKHTGHTLPESPLRSPTYQSPPSHPEHGPSQTPTHGSLEPPPPSGNLSIPQFASATPIYASESEMADLPEEEFSTYVGGIDGSGVDDLDQTGSLGYPSSLGASYLESYMQSRPLSVRMAAAEKAGLRKEERQRLMNSVQEEDMDVEHEHLQDVDEGMEVIGSMEGF